MFQKGSGCDTQISVSELSEMGVKGDGWCQWTEESGMRSIGCGDLGDNVKQERGVFCW